MSDRNKYDDAYDHGYLEGKNDDALGSFSQGLVKGYHLGDEKGTEAYNAGYDDGARDRRDDDNSHYRGKSRKIRENWELKQQIREEQEHQARIRREAHQSQPSGSIEDALLKLGAKVIVGFIVIAVVVWLIAAVVIPLVIINLATIALLSGLASKMSRRVTFSISVLASLFIVLDYNSGWMTKYLVGNLSFFLDFIPFFFAINVIAGLVAAYFLIRDHLKIKLPERLAMMSSENRNYILIGTLILTGCTTGGLQYYIDLGTIPKYISQTNSISINSSTQVPSTIRSNPSTTNAPDQIIVAPIDNLFKAWSQLDFNLYMQQWHTTAAQYSNKFETRHYQDIYKSRQSLFSRLSSVNVAQKDLVRITRGQDNSATAIVKYSMVFHFKNGKVVKESDVIEKYVVRYDNVAQRWMIFHNYDYIE